MPIDRPNLIFVFADQLRYQSLGYAGDEYAHTPNIDRLAEESFDFSQAVVSMPVCSAMRASLFTGKYATSTGMVINEIRMNTNHRCLAHCLNEGGYETSYIGKWHMYANELGNHFDAKNSFVPPGPDRLGFDGYWAGYNFHHNYYDVYYHENTPDKIPYPEGMYEPDAQTDMAVKELERLSAGEKPFTLFLSYGTPHDPWEESNVPENFYDMFRDTDFPLSPSYRDENDEPYGDAWSNEKKSPELINGWKRAYYAMTANLDWNIGRLQKALDEKELAENTVFVFTSDHGEMFGAHGRMKKNIFYEEAARVPFLIKQPGRINSSKSDACFCCVDIMPTLLGLLGLDIPEDVEGMDVSHLVLGKDGPEPEFAFLQNTGACALWENGHEWRAFRDKQYTYAVYKVDGKELLFDNADDPYQMTNLAGSSEYNEKREELKGKMEIKMKSLNDTFEDSLWYKKNWISEDRIIQRTATME